MNNEPKPCPVCGNTHIYTLFVGGGLEGLLPFWVRMQCPECKRTTKKKLFRARAVRAWNREGSLWKHQRTAGNVCTPAPAPPGTAAPAVNSQRRSGHDQ